MKDCTNLKRNLPTNKMSEKELFMFKQILNLSILFFLINLINDKVLN